MICCPQVTVIGSARKADVSQTTSAPVGPAWLTKEAVATTAVTSEEELDSESDSGWADNNEQNEQMKKLQMNQFACENSHIWPVFTSSHSGTSRSPENKFSPLFTAKPKATHPGLSANDYFSLCLSMIFLYLNFTPTGQSRWPPSGVLICSRFLPLGEFFLTNVTPCLLWRVSIGFLFDWAKHFETPLDVILCFILKKKLSDWFVWGYNRQGRS